MSIVRNLVQFALFRRFRSFGLHQLREGNSQFLELSESIKNSDSFPSEDAKIGSLLLLKEIDKESE